MEGKDGIDFYGEMISDAAFRIIEDNHKRYLEFANESKRSKQRSIRLRKDAYCKVNELWKKRKIQRSKSDRKRIIVSRAIASEVLEPEPVSVPKSEPNNGQYIRDQKKRPILIQGDAPIRHSVSQTLPAKTLEFPVDRNPKEDAIPGPNWIGLRFVEYKAHCFWFEWKDEKNKTERFQISNLDDLTQKTISVGKSREKEEVPSADVEDAKAEWKVFHQSRWIKMSDFMKEYFESIKRQSEKARLLAPLNPAPPAKGRKKPKHNPKQKEERQDGKEPSQSDLVNEKNKLIQILAGKIQTAATCMTEKDIESWRTELKRDLKL